MKLETCVYQKGKKWLEGFIAYDDDGMEIVIDKKTGTLVGETCFLFEGHAVVFKNHKVVKIEGR